MERCESTAKLLDCDQLDLISDSKESEEYSSGYDSVTESSDADSGNEGNPRDVKDDTRDGKRYRSTHVLCNDLKYILSMPELCDVTFLVGEKKYPVYGVKAILSTRSRVFYNLILKTQRQMEVTAAKKDKKKTAKLTTSYPHHTVIEVNKYKPDDFRRIIQFVHCGTIDINVGNVVGLYCGASQFELSDLKMASWDYIQHTLKRDSDIFSRLSVEIQKYSHHKSSYRLLTKVTDFVSSITDSNISPRRKETVL